MMHMTLLNEHFATACSTTVLGGTAAALTAIRTICIYVTNAAASHKCMGTSQLLYNQANLHGQAAEGLLVYTREIEAHSWLKEG